VAGSKTSISLKATKAVSAGRMPKRNCSTPTLWVGSRSATCRVSCSRIRHTAALSARVRRANGDGNAAPVPTGFTATATLLMALASDPDSGTVPRSTGSAVYGCATSPSSISVM
jgi:hypothetical protein